MRWGVMGTGGVAHAFAEALLDVPDAVLAGIGSRARDKAHRFGERFGIPSDRAYDTYPELVASPFVDVIYVATPASHHHAHTMLALKAGKHALVEKPFAASAFHADEMFIEAHNRGLLCMEAMWPRFLPAWSMIRSLANEIGEVRSVEASFGGRAEFNPRARPFRRDLGGGALLDAAVYPLNLAQMIYGTFTEVYAVGMIGQSGVDEQAAILCRTEGGRFAVAQAAITTTFKGDATIYGTDGMIVIPGNFTNPPWVELHYPGRPPEHHDFIPYRHRLSWQAEAFQEYVARGETDAYLAPRAATLEVARVLDEARHQIGLPPVPEVTL